MTNDCTNARTPRCRDGRQRTGVRASSVRAFGVRAPAECSGPCTILGVYAVLVKLDELVIDIDRVATICARFGVVRLDVFGSFATGDADVDSDIDLLYELAPDRQLGWEIEELSEELEVALSRSVDLIARRSLHPQLRDTVLSEAQSLYAA